MKTTRKGSQQPDNLIFSQVHVSGALTIVDILINKAFHYAASENGGQCHYRVHEIQIEFSAAGPPLPVTPGESGFHRLIVLAMNLCE